MADSDQVPCATVRVGTFIGIQVFYQSSIIKSVFLLQSVENRRQDNYI